jgi:hypothetical protein
VLAQDALTKHKGKQVIQNKELELHEMTEEEQQRIMLNR